MINEEKMYDLIKFEDGDFSLDVKVDPSKDTVWLTANQIALLFDRDEKTIRKHINNALDEECDFSTVAKFETVQLEGNRSVKRSIEHYNLDIIISVGYRVKSQNGVLFRKWATSILKEYLLKGFSLNNSRVSVSTENYINLLNVVNNISSNQIDINNRLLKLEDIIYAESSKMIYEGEILEPYTFIRKLLFLAKNEITIIDNYADKFLISMLRDIKVNIKIITSSSSYLNKEEIPSNIKLIYNDLYHDRFLIIDEAVYIIGTSFNEIGKKRFVIMRVKDITKNQVLKK